LGFGPKFSEGLFHASDFAFTPHSLQIGGHGRGTARRSIKQHALQGVTLDFHLPGHFIGNRITQTLQMRRKDRFKYRKKLTYQFAVIVYTREQLRYIEHRCRRDIHLVAPSMTI
jgi:hypothetical protein